ncbi:MAG: FtsX-like permease family protein [Bacteroidales bacterium]|nr:FtsX-like permease family protein [Bacteroidales bacterium]
MFFPLFIARRYLIAKKSHNIINIITLISVIGVMIATGGLIIVLSVFNGFEGLVLGLFNSFNPDLKVTVAEGKTFTLSPEEMQKIKQLPGINYVVETLEETALARFGDRQHIVKMKGVSDDFTEMTPLDDFMLNGHYTLGSDQRPASVIGAGVAYYLGIYPEEFAVPMSLYLPKRTRKVLTGLPDQTFNNRQVHVAGVFAIQQEFDMSHVIVPVALARELLEFEDETSALEIGLQRGTNIAFVIKSLQNILGSGFVIKDRYEQQVTLYRVMKSEKWAIYFILTFILVIAAFNMVGSLSMLIIDKKKDIAVLWSLGAGKPLIKRIFYAEGLLISLSGGLLGLILGGLTAILQQEFGLLKLGGGEGSYIVDAYPVQVQLTDFLMVMATVILIGLATTWYPVRQISRKYLSGRMNYLLMR